MYRGTEMNAGTMHRCCGAFFTICLSVGFLTLPIGKVAAQQGPTAGVKVAQARTSANNELESLINSAKAEGEVFLYAGTLDTLTRKLTKAFTETYGIKVSYLRIAGIQLRQRFASEAQSGVYAADVMISSNDPAFLDEAIKKGWMEPISKAKLPVMLDGTFPSKFTNGLTATIQINPWAIGYRTDKIDAKELKDWPDVLKPSLTGQVIYVDPRANVNYLYFYNLLVEKYGKEFLVKLGQQGRAFNQSTIAIQSLAAGEGIIMMPTVGQQTVELSQKGAPIELAPFFNYTAGAEIELMMPAADKVKHPNAARLFANFLMSPEGNAILNSDFGSVSVYDVAKLPADYHPAKYGSTLDEILKILGLK
jgi:iron(III) transport system substrate-binding protein